MSIEQSETTVQVLSVHLDSRGVITDADDNLPLFLAPSQHAAVGRHYKDVFIEPIWSIVHDSIRQALDGNHSHCRIDIALGAKTKNIEGFATPLSSSGVLTGIQLTLVDITKHVDVVASLSSLQSRHDAFVDTARESIHVIDLDTGLYVDMNEAGLKMLGITRDEMHTVTMADISAPIQDDGLPPDLSFQRRLQHLFANDGYAEGEWRIIDPATSEERIHEYRAALVEGSNHLRITELDVTDRVLAERALKASVARYRMMTENHFEAIVILDSTTMNFVDGNRLSCQIYGVSPEELVTIGPLHVSAANQPPEQLPAELVAQQHIESVLRDGRVVFEWIHRNLSTDEEILCEVRLETISDIQPGLVRASVVDITEKKKMDAQLHQSEKMRAIGQLAEGIAHDYNNILGIIAGSADLISLDTKNVITPESQRRIEAIRSTAKRASELTSRLSVFGRTMELPKLTFSLHDIVENALSMLRETIDRNITISHNLTASNEMVHGSSAAIESMALNVFINAIQAMEQTGGELSVVSENVQLVDGDFSDSLFKIDTGEYIKLSISDTGIGIAQQDIERIFEPFFSRRKDQEGTGLGLAVVYGTVQDHHGAINVASTLGKGSTFEFYLPAITREDVDARRSGLPNLREHETKCILVVDDEEELRLILSDMLRRLGNEVLYASNGEEAVDVFRRRPSEIDAVFMDINMPTVGGAKAIEEIGAIDEKCPIVVCTGYASESLSWAGNVVGIVEKPFDFKDVRAVLDNLAGKRSSHS